MEVVSEFRTVELITKNLTYAYTSSFLNEGCSTTDEQGKARGALVAGAADALGEGALGALATGAAADVEQQMCLARRHYAH